MRSASAVALSVAVRSSEAWLADSIASIASPCVVMPLRASSTALAVRSSKPSTVSDIVAVTLSSRAPAVSLVASIRAMFAASRSAAPLVSASASLPRSASATICASSAAARSLAVRPVRFDLRAQRVGIGMRLGQGREQDVELVLRGARRGVEPGRPVSCGVGDLFGHAARRRHHRRDLVAEREAVGLDRVRHRGDDVLQMLGLDPHRQRGGVEARASALLDRRAISHSTPMQDQRHRDQAERRVADRQRLRQRPEDGAAKQPKKPIQPSASRIATRRQHLARDARRHFIFVEFEPVARRPRFESSAPSSIVDCAWLRRPAKRRNRRRSRADRRWLNPRS